MGGVLIMNSGTSMRAKILTPPDLVASPLVVPEGFLLNTLPGPQTPGALNLKVGKYVWFKFDAPDKWTICQITKILRPGQ